MSGINRHRAKFPTAPRRMCRRRRREINAALRRAVDLMTEIVNDHVAVVMDNAPFVVFVRRSHVRL